MWWNRRNQLLTDRLELGELAAGQRFGIICLFIAISQSGDLMKNYHSHSLEILEIFKIQTKSTDRIDTFLDRTLFKNTKEIYAHEAPVLFSYILAGSIKNLSRKETLVMKKIKIFGTSITIAKRRFFSWRPDVWSSSSPILVTGTGINLMQRVCWVFCGKSGKCMNMRGSIMKTFKSNMFWHMHTLTVC